jgi:hypothetical protein
MTLLQNPQLNDGDIELLSAYIDNQLAAGERGALEERLRLDPRLQAALEELRGTVAVLREIEPLPLPRSFTLDPAAFARRPSPLFGWLRLGATLASLLLAMTFAVDLVRLGGSSGSVSAPAAAAPTAAPQVSDSASAERSGFSQATAAPAAAAATAAPEAAEAPAMPAAPMPASEPTAALLIAAEPTAAPPAAGAPAATAAPAADAALPTQTTLPDADTQSSETTITEPEAPLSAPAAEATSPPAAYSPLDSSTKTVPGDTSGGQAQDSAPPAQRAPAPQSAIRPLRLFQIGLASLVLLLGLAAIWVRRRGS